MKGIYSRFTGFLLGLFLIGVGLAVSWAVLEEVRSIQQGVGVGLQAIATISLCCGVAMLVLPRGILMLMMGLFDYKGQWAGHVHVLRVFGALKVLGILCVVLGIACFLMSFMGNIMTWGGLDSVQ